MQSIYHQPRKRFGQHFLIDTSIISRIVNAIDLRPHDKIIEIGPGLGALTKELLPIVKEMAVVELDRDVIPKLKALCQAFGRLVIYQEDALKFDFSSVGITDKLLRVVGNLPYNISTPLLFHLLEYKNIIQDMHFMLQKEVVERLIAPVSSHHYNRLSVMIQYHCQTELLFIVPPTAFHPPPKVDSAVVRLKPYVQLPFIATDYQRFADIVRIAFLHRRKTLKNNLKDLFSVMQLEAVGIDAKLRPQDLTVEQYVRLANYQL